MLVQKEERRRRERYAGPTALYIKGATLIHRLKPVAKETAAAPRLGQTGGVVLSRVAATCPLATGFSRWGDWIWQK